MIGWAVQLFYKESSSQSLPGVQCNEFVSTEQADITYQVGVARKLSGTRMNTDTILSLKQTDFWPVGFTRLHSTVCESN